MKTCCSCKTLKELNHFYKSAEKGTQNECKNCTKARKSVWIQSEQGKKSAANTKLKRRLDITLEEYESLAEGIHHKCEICGDSEARGTRLSVDHDHIGGFIRGLLCRDCNLMIGYAKDNKKTLEKAIAYLSERAVNL